MYSHSVADRVGVRKFPPEGSQDEASHRPHSPSADLPYLHFLVGAVLGSDSLKDSDSLLVRYVLQSRENRMAELARRGGGNVETRLKFEGSEMVDELRLE